MKVKIEVEKYRNVKKYGIINDLAKETFEITLKAVKSELDEVFKNIECENHKSDTKGKIIISANNPQNNLTFKVKDTCCDSFKNTIEKSFKK